MLNNFEGSHVVVSIILNLSRKTSNEFVTGPGYKYIQGFSNYLLEYAHFPEKDTELLYYH